MATPSRFYVPELDGLRFFAFLMVFVSHALPGIDGPNWLAAGVHAGKFGVDVFFVLSAYLITEILVREHERTGSIQVRAFYLRRCLRIWPLYFVFLGAMSVFHALHHHRELLPVALWFAVFAGNWECAFHGFPLSAISPLWTVSIEEQFYLLWPLILAFITPKRIVPAVVCLLVMGTASRALVAFLGFPHPAMWCITFTRVDPIALGILAVPLSRRFGRARGALERIVALACGALLLVLVSRFGTIREGYGCLLSYPLVAMGAFLLVAALIPPGHGPLRLPPLAWPPLVFLGRISYGLYVLHPLAIAVATHLLARVGSRGDVFVAGLSVDVAAGATSYLLLERPFLRLKTRFTVVESRPGG